MKFSELVRLLEKNGFKLIKEKGSIGYYRKQGHSKLIRVDYHGSKEVPTDLKYSLVIEATDDPDFFGFYSPELEGFTGVGHSIEDCLYKAKWGMEEHIEFLKSEGLTVPKVNPNPTVIIQNANQYQEVSN